MMQMPLEFIKLSQDEFFERHDGYTPEWWQWRPSMGGGKAFFSVRDQGTEIARVELDKDLEKEDLEEYPVPDIEEPLEIQFIEVSSKVRRQGYGRRVVQEITRAHPGKRLVAFSEGADDFWASIGWNRFDHPEGPRWQRPLFVAP